MSQESSLPLQPGELVILTDSKGRHYLRTLQPGKVESLRRHRLEHDRLIGQREGTIISSLEKDFLMIFRPTLADFLLKMPRGAQIIYPKDAALLLFLADIFPGARVIETGTGSGGLTLALLRAVGEKGTVISYELRPDFARVALANIQRFLGPCPNLILKEANVYEGIEETDADRVLLDLPQPWVAVPHAAGCLKDGGILASFSPHVSQCQMTVAALKATGRFWIKDTLEVLLRSWVIGEQVNRPAHRMVAHTGFITLARKLASPG